MSIGKPQGLPPLDTPRPFEADPRPCKRCVHSFYRADDPDHRYLMCSRGSYAQQCRYERDKDGECKPGGQFWKERNI